MIEVIYGEGSMCCSVSKTLETLDVSRLDT